MNGLIGGLARRSLASHCTLRALNRSPIDGVDTVRADINDLDAIRPAFDGIDTVVHLAAYLGDDPAGLLSTNITGTYHVFEAARAAGVRRVVYASSGATVAGYEADEPYRAMVEARWDDVPADRPAVTPDDPVRPIGIYAATKLFGEALARHYADSHGLSMICLRIGRVLDGDKPRDPRRRRSTSATATWCRRSSAASTRPTICASRSCSRSPTTAAATATWSTRAGPSASSRRTARTRRRRAESDEV